MPSQSVNADITSGGKPIKSILSDVQTGNSDNEAPKADKED